MADLRLLDLTVLPPPSGPGDTRYARFDAEIGLVVVRGAVLARVHNGKVLAMLPRCRDNACSLRFADCETQTRLTALALAAYRAAGGLRGR